MDPRIPIGLARAYRLGKDHPAAARVCEEARRRHPDDLALLLEDARVSLHQYRHAAEDEEHAWKVRVLDIAARLDEHRRRGATSGQLLLVLGELVLGLGRWDEAAALWGTVEERFPGRRSTACVKQAEALRNKGELRAAREALERLHPSEVTQPRVRRELERLGVSLGRWTATELAQQSRLRFVAGDAGAASAQLMTAVELRGHDTERLAPALNALEDLLRDAFGPPGGPSKGEAPAPPVPAEAAVPVIHVCGFLYSGSGAVVDLLRGRSDLHEPFGSREPGFLKKRGNIAELLVPASRAPDVFPAEVARVVLASLLGLGQSGRPIIDLVASDAVEPTVEASQALVAALRHDWSLAMTSGGEVREDAVRAALRRFVDAVVAAATPSGERRAALLDNAILPHQLDRLRLFADACAVVVLRDPLDQYVSQRLEAPYPLGPEAFVETMLQRYEGLLDLLSDHSVRTDIRIVHFEQVVTELDERQALLRWLGLDPSIRVAEPSGFDPARSQRNVGIHRDYEPRDEVRFVRERMGERYASLRSQLPSGR